MILIIILLLVVVIILLLFISISAFFFTFDLFLELPYVAAKKKQVEAIINIANIKPGEIVVDLGSGDGRLLFAAARKGAIAIGYEINPFLVLLTRLRARFLGYSSSDPAFHEWRGSREVSLRRSSRQARTLNKGVVIVKRQNLWEADLKKADVIFVYAYRKSMPKFQDFVFSNVKKGSRIVVNTNPFPNKKPTKSENGIFLYIKS